MSPDPMPPNKHPIVLRHFISPKEIEEVFASLSYSGDNRNPPDELRRSRFLIGWEDAAIRGKIYSGDTLKRLTWMNLGFRFGSHFGVVSSGQIDAAYEHLAILWDRVWGVSASQDASLVPSAAQYESAFRSLQRISDNQMQMLRLHYFAPNQTLTATQMTVAMGYSHYSLANSQYGRLGRMVGERLEFNPMKERLGTLVTFEKRQDEWHWILRPQVAIALKQLGWVEGPTIYLLPEELAATSETLVEGAVCRVPANVYERNPEARRQCIAAYGTTCEVCSFNFGKRYGEIGEGFIHVHHIRQVSERGGEYVVRPLEDLRPVCANCHAIIHRRTPAYSIEEVKEFICHASSSDEPSRPSLTIEEPSPEVS